MNTQFSKSLRTLVGVAAMAGIVSGTVGCTDEDVAVLGTIAIVAGAIAIGSGGGHDDHRDDHRGPDRGDHDRGGRGGRWEMAGTSFALQPAPSEVSNVAAKYNLPMESATRLTAILQDGAAGRTTTAALGISKDESVRMASYQMPSDAALDQIASKLAMSQTMARSLVQKLMDDTRAQMADVRSDAWVACQSTGRWQTDHNSGTCESTNWPGCSPDTGASLCASVK